MKIYPAKTVRKLLETDFVTEPTRRALEKRLVKIENFQPKFFDAEIFQILRAVCERLILQEDAENFVDCAALIDEKLSANKGDGWRYDALPNDIETFQKGLQNINRTAVSKYDQNFQQINEKHRDAILSEVQNGETVGEIWKNLVPELFFEELLAAATEVYYSHPLAQEKIGYVGMADAGGWQKIKLDELEEREPTAVGETN